MDEFALVTCPYCMQTVEFYVDPGTKGSYVEDCEVCCRPWRVFVSRDQDGGLSVQLERSQ